ncbi:MAG TPA: EAL domain-containing protein [Casimicrobiaceae bacterium]|nr:EAL domain-containing protein [Casimicrobiaceae bacterium]
MSSDSIYLARQPIVDLAGSLVGYELLFRSSPAEVADHDDSVLATSTVIANAFGELGVSEVLGSLDGYLNVDTEFLTSELVETLPPKRVVLELLEERVLDGSTEQRCNELRAKGYRIALDGFVGNLDERSRLLPAVDMVKIDFTRVDPLLVPVIVKMVRKHPVRMVAEKIESPTQFEQAKALGIELFQGFHFARPQLLTAKRAKPANLALLRLLSLVMADSEIRQIEEEFKHHPALTLNLLRLVNSAAAGMRQQVTSLRHALILLGRRQLQVWLQLMLYTADRSNGALRTPLLQLAAVRGKLMELLASEMSGAPAPISEQSFMTGILSLMDIVLDMPHSEILRELELPPPVAGALLTRRGQIADLLTLTEALERDDRPTLSCAIERLPNLDLATLAPLQAQAFRWAHQLTS